MYHNDMLSFNRFRCIVSLPRCSAAAAAMAPHIFSFAAEAMKGKNGPLCVGVPRSGLEERSAEGREREKKKKRDALNHPDT